MMVGIGVLFAIFLYTILLFQLFSNGWPAPAKTAGMFVMVGPIGQYAAALQLLGSAASTYGRFGGYHRGVFLKAPAAASLDAACVLIALMLTGLGCVLTFLVVYAIAEKASHRELSWTPNWNGINFPAGTLTTSLLVFSVEMDSPAFRFVTTAHGNFTCHSFLR